MELIRMCIVSFGVFSLVSLFMVLVIGITIKS